MTIPLLPVFYFEIDYWFNVRVYKSVWKGLYTVYIFVYILLHKWHGRLWSSTKWFRLNSKHCPSNNIRLFTSNEIFTRSQLCMKEILFEEEWALIYFWLYKASIDLSEVDKTWRDLTPPIYTRTHRSAVSLICWKTSLNAVFDTLFSNVMFRPDI